ncbi:MAG: phage tail tape measure protein [Geobacteraceae bacterium]|nr:phage tail tape measure protein [Geobacteraceae bacterium]
MADMKLFIELLARSTGLKRELRDSESGFRRFGATARQEMDRIKQASGSLQGKLAALGLTVGALQQLRMSAQLDKGLTQVKQTAGETGDVVKGLRKEFFEMSRQTGRDVDGMKTGFDSLIQSGQSWKAAFESTRGINIANAVTGANEKTLAGGLTVGATAYNIDLEKPGQALVLLDKMVVAGRLGNAELENLSDIFARVGVNAAGANMGFDKTLAFIEALSMVERQPERLATLADSTLRVFTNLRYMAEAQKGTGVKFFDAKGARRDTVEVLKDIKAKWDKLKTDRDRAVFIQRAFGKADLDTIKGLRTLLQGDSLTKVESFTKQIGTASGTLERDLPEAINNAVDQTGRLKSALRKAADEFAQPINRLFSDIVKFSLDKKANGGLELSGKQILGGTAAIVGGTYLAARLGNSALKGVAQRLLSKGGSTAIGVAEGKALQAATGVTPVFVTNWPGSGVPVPGVPGGINAGGGTAGGAASTAAGSVFGGAMARVKDWWKIAGTPVAKGASYLPMLATRAGFVGAAAGGGYLLGTGINKGMGWLTGISSGGRYKGDGWLGEMIYDMVHGRSGGTMRPGAARNEIKIDLQIDGQGRVFARSNDMNTSADVGGRRGNFFDALMTTEAM